MSPARSAASTLITIAPTGAETAKADVPARPSTFGTLGTPASLPSWVVTILESRRSRSAAAGWTTLRPGSAASASGSSANSTKTTLPPGPCEAIHSRTSPARV